MRRRALPAALSLALAGCAGATPPPAPPSASYTPDAPLPGAVVASFTLPRGAEPPAFFELPWPTDLRRKPDGRPDFRGYPDHDTLLFGAYVDAAEEDVEGYALSTAVYFHFSGPIPRSSLPADPRALASATSPVFLVDVDPASPERGAFVPLTHRFYAEARSYVPAHTLAVKPAAGALLRPGTLYAAVVRRELGGPGAALGTAMDLEIVKWTSPRPEAREERARLLHQGALDLVAALGVPRERVAALAVFRTHTPHAVTARLVDVIAHLSRAEAPRVLDAAWRDALSDPGHYATIEGTYCTPNFQADLERAPFLVDAGGRFTLDATGAPRVVPVPPDSAYHSPACGGLMRARFVLTVPTAHPMPAGGFPLLLSAHGTGGDARSFLGPDDFAGWAASQGVAVVSTDQPVHGSRGVAPRPGSREPLAIPFAGIPITLSRDSAEAAFYNPLHPAAARDNLRQAAADLMVLARLFTSADLAPHLSGARPAPRFDRARLLAAGHSQGSQSVAAAGAVDPLLRGVILSGCGGDARLGILGRDDLPIVPAFALLLGLAPGELDELHPLLTLVQTLADPIDPASYARLYWEPLPGRRAPRVLHFEGLDDTFNPPVTAELLAVALRAQPIARLARPVAGLGAPAASLAAALAGDGPARLFGQYRPTHGENGHFVLYEEPGAADVVRRFLRALVDRP
jgi:hypothetical protein